MDYKVQFVGLTGFIREVGVVRALLPDGRFTSPDITPHYASITVSTGDLASSVGWTPDEVVELSGHTNFFILRPSYVVFPSTVNSPPVDFSNLGSGLRHLTAVDPHFLIAAEPNWIASLTIDCGVLDPKRWPNTPNDGTPAYLTQWDVPSEDAAITIRVTPRKGWPEKTIVLNNNTGNLVVTVLNSSRETPAPAGNADHFQIYEELSAAPVVLKSQLNVVGVLESTIPLPQFAAPAFALLRTGCSGAIADNKGVI
jgi:hypothetical protein